MRAEVVPVTTRRRGAWLTALIVALALSSGAAAQTYQLSQAGHTLGTFDQSLTETATGIVSRSRLQLTNLADLTDQLVAGPEGAASSYRLEGTARGARIGIDVTIHGTSATVKIQRGSTNQTRDLTLPGPVAIVDNNMLDGWQVLVDSMPAGATAPKRFDVLVPQALVLGRVTLTPAGAGSVAIGGKKVRAERFDAEFVVAGQDLKIILWQGADGRLVAFEQPAASVRFELQTSASQAAAAAQASAVAVARATLEKTLAKEASCLTERTLVVHSTGATLSGSLTVPKNAQAAPALLLLPGSGAVDRNGDAPPLLTNEVYRQLAYGLACQGFAVLRIDKLGIGASTGDGGAATLQTYAQNAADWMALLRRQPGVDARRVALMGHSEGGLIALYAAAQGIASPAAVVLLESPGLPLDAVILDQLTVQARLRGASKAEIEATRAQAQAAIDAVKHSTGTSAQLSGALAHDPLAVAFARYAGLLRSEFAQDPAALAARIDVPIIIIQGGKDVQVTTQNGQALARAAPHGTYLFIPDLEHDLYETQGSAIAHAMPGPGTLVSPTLMRSLHTLLSGFLTAAG